MPDELLTGYQEVLLPGGETGAVNMATHGNNVTHYTNEQGGSVRRPVTIRYSAPTYGKLQRVATLPSGIDLHNVIDLESLMDVVNREDEKLLLPKTQAAPTSSAPSSSYTLRNRGVMQSKLVYDVKYHPMDESIRPSQAAKRRSAHGEQLLSDDSCDSFHEPSDTETDSPIQPNDKSEFRNAPKKATTGKKRKRNLSQEAEPTRRSSRKTTCSKTAYNMNVHPQDEDLKILSANDSDLEVLTRKRRKVRRARPTIELDSDGRVFNPPKSEHRKQTPAMNLTSFDNMGFDSDSMFINEQGSARDTGLEKNIDLLMETPSLTVSSGATPHPHGIRRKEGLDVWKLLPGDRYFRHDRDSWPVYPAQSFEVFEERLEDQLAAEAMALSPLNYEHDDKENNINAPDREPMPSPLEGMSVMSASPYRRVSEDSQVSRQIVLDSHTTRDPSEEGPQPYNLGRGGVRDSYLHILSASSTVDSVFGPSSPV